MNAKNRENALGPGRTIRSGPARFRNGRGAQLLVAAAIWIGVPWAASHAQTVIGSPGAGFQHWTVADLNNNGAPYWDAATKSVANAPNSANIGFCMTGTGDCGGVIKHPPGPLPFWGLSFKAGKDAPGSGALDPKVYFHRAAAEHEALKASLELQFTTSAEAKAINEIGWFETNAAGSVLGTRHVLFRGAGNPVGSTTPDPVGKKVAFKPTEYFGYYFTDVSELSCHAYTLSGFNDAPGCNDNHNLVVFSTHPGSHRATFWIAGEDPPGCGDGDCNLTVIKVSSDE
jgi:hypothetical protein